MNIGKVALDRVKISLLVALLAISTLPFIPAFAGSLWLVMVCVALMLGLAAAVKKAWGDVALALYVTVGFTIGHMMYPDLEDAVLTLRAAAILAFILLNITLLIGPWAHFVRRIARIYKYRRHIGVTAFLLGLTHANLVLSWYYNYSLPAAYTTTFVFFGSTGLYIMSVLAFTSWDVMQKKVPAKWWSIAHTTLLAGYIGYIAFFMQYALDLETWHKITLGIFLVYWLLVSPWGLPKRILQRVSGWKQTHVLIYIAYVSLVIHVWTGTLMFAQIDWLKIAFWILVSFVTLSHLVGRVIALMQYMARRRAPKTTTERDGKTFYRVGTAAEFIEGRGKKVVAAEKEIAIFRNNDKLFGMSAICPHQQGPIAEGCIVDGYVQCPWHGYQFNVDTGFGPSEFGDCIPYYTVIEDRGVVYVCSESTGTCSVK